MEKRLPRPDCWILVFALFLVLSGSWKCLAAAAGAGASLDVVVKIKDLGKTMDLLESFMAPEPGKPSLSPFLLLRGMLHGTDWMDFSRLMVVGIRITEPQPEMTVLIPYRHPNPEFQTAYQASAGPGYYLVVLPPGSGKEVPPEIRAQLETQSRAKTDHAISAEAALAGALEKYSDKIQAALQKLEGISAGSGPRPAPLSGEEIREMGGNLMGALRQIAHISFGMDLEKERMAVAFGATAGKGSRLEKLFHSGDATFRFAGYAPDRQVVFRSRAYPVSGMTAFFQELFGKFYERMGIDFAALSGIFDHFTGEAAGGLSYGKSRTDMEMVAVLTKPAGAGFLEKELIPRMQRYAQSMAAVMETHTGVITENPLERTPDSRVAGHPVVGIKTAFPVSPMGADLHPPGASSGPMICLARMAVVGDLLLVAPDDMRLQRLMEISGPLKEKPEPGPLMTMDMDVGAYMQAILEMMPGGADSLPPLPKTGKATFTLDLKDGRAVAVSSMGTEDLKKLAEGFRRIAAGSSENAGPLVPPAKKASGQSPVLPEPGAEKKEIRTEPVRDARYWFDRGALVAAYGNNHGAIRFFHKAIEMEPAMAEAYFNLGVAYGETGDFRKGVDAIERAIALGSSKALCYYGRGRIYIQAGEMEKGMADIRQAAALGNEDAKNYLDRHP